MGAAAATSVQAIERALRNRFKRRRLLMLFGGLAAACGGEFRPLATGMDKAADANALPPIRFPVDDLPHRNLTEWWYFSGHLGGGSGGEYGFEFVVFQGIRGDSPLSYAAHFAITDPLRGRFTYDQRVSALHGASAAAGLDLCVGGWNLTKLENGFAMSAEMNDTSLSLVMVPTKPPVNHNVDGVLDFNPFGWSYYYSYPRLEAFGQLTLDGVPIEVKGMAWMDHQWGDFISVGSGGWDWFSVQLDDGRDFTASDIRGESGQTVLKYGTIIEASGASRHLAESDFSIAARDTWLSPNTGARYPSAWYLSIPSADIFLDLRPVMADQELDARGSTGKIYWEGSVQAFVDDEVVGRGYVELTGYAPDRFVQFPASSGPTQDLCK